MTGLRAPVVGGVGGGVGTTTVAVALRGHDAGRVTGRRPDIVVCRATLHSLRRAAAVVENAEPEARPVLAVTLDAARAARRPIHACLELLEPDFGALVLLPYVRRWATLADPLAEAARLLAGPTDRLPRPLRPYATALRELVDAVTAAGRLNAVPDDRRTRRTDADERHGRRTGSDERHTRPPAPDERHWRSTGSDEGAVRRQDIGTGSWPATATTPADMTASRRRRGVQIVRPDGVLPSGVQHPRTRVVAAAAARPSWTTQAEPVEHGNPVAQAERADPTEQTGQLERTEHAGRAQWVG